MNSFLSNPAIVVFLLIGALSLGFLAGYALHWAIRPAAQEKETDTEQAARDPSPEKPVTTFNPPNKKWEEVAHLWRAPNNGSLIFQIGDAHYKHGADLTPKERKILLKVVMDFYHWLEPPRPAKPEAAESSAIPAPVVPMDAEAKKLRRSFTPANIIANALKAEFVPNTEQPISMVMQINEILQEKLKEAEMQKMAVRLIELPDRGMVVLVGLEQYESIDEVPYESVKQIVRASVSDWEERVAAGRITRKRP